MENGRQVPPRGSLPRSYWNYTKNEGKTDKKYLLAVFLPRSYEPTRKYLLAVLYRGATNMTILAVLHRGTTYTTND